MGRGNGARRQEAIQGCTIERAALVGNGDAGPEDCSELVQSTSELCPLGHSSPSSHMSVTEGCFWGNTIPMLQPAVMGWRGAVGGDKEAVAGSQQHIGVGESSEDVGSTNVTANSDTGWVCPLRHSFNKLLSTPIVQDYHP